MTKLKLKALIVDDEPETIWFLKDRLESEGFDVRVLTTEDQFDGLSGDELRSYGLAILDVKVGRVETTGGSAKIEGQSAGVRMVKRIRLIEGIPERQLKVMVYSVVPDKAVIREMRSMGCEYVLKGDTVIAERLKAVIQKLREQS